MCALCKKNPRDMLYAVDPNREVPLCGRCFGKWAPSELASLLGLKHRNEPTIDLAARGVRILD